MNTLNLKKMIGGTLVLAGAMLIHTAPAMAQNSGNAGDYNYAPTGNLVDLVSRIALYPDPLLAQIFAAAAFPDQIAASAQGSGGPFDPSVEALMQYPSVLQMMASDPGWTQALGESVMQDENSVMDTIQDLRRQAQQYGYLQSGPQMQVVDDAGYIDIMPPSGSMYVPVYDPYVVFARPRPGFFVGGAIRFGAGFRWVSGYNRFDWRRHEVFVNRRVWTPPVRPAYVPAQRANPQQRFEGNRPNFTGGNRAWNSNNTAPAVESRAQRTFRPEQPRRDFTRPMEQRSFTPQPPVQHRNMTAPSTMEQRNQSRNHGSFGRGAEGRGRNR